LKKDLAFLRKLFSKQKFAVLGTLHNMQSYQSLIAFTSTYDLKNLLFSTRRDTQKYSNIKKNARVALLIDNRSNSEKDFKQAVAVTALGIAREVEDTQHARMLELFLDKHPQMEEFVKSPLTCLFQVDVDTYLIVSRFQKVQKLKV